MPMTFNMMGIWCLSFAILFSRRYGGCAGLVLCSSCNETLKLILVSIGGIILLALGLLSISEYWEQQRILKVVVDQ